MKVNLVQRVPSTNAAVAPSVIVPEVLKEDNYERWSILMQHYLVAQDLWDVVLSSQIPLVEDPRDWVKKNALALHAIKISCGAKAFDQIKKMNAAKDAWDALADLHKLPNVVRNKGGETDTGILDNKERAEFATLLKDIYAGDWDALKHLDNITEIIFPSGFTVLHIATIAGQLSIVNELVKKAREDYLEIQDDNGDTALSLAACNGEMKIAECLVQKNDRLLTIANNEGHIPLVVACFNRQKDIASYLYSITRFEFLLPENSDQGTLFLKYCALNFMLDVGFDLFLCCPRLAASGVAITIPELSAQPSLFPSTSSLHFLDLFLYKCLDIVEPSPSAGMDRSKQKIFRSQVALVKVMDGILGLFLFLYRRTLGIGRLKDIYNQKLTHKYAYSVLHYWCKEISTYKDATQLVESGAISAIFQAIREGTSEIVIEILKASPDLIWCNERLSRDIVISAIKYRRGVILRFVYGLDAGKKAFLSLRDEDGNNVLHLVAKLPDLWIYSLESAWIMQWEIKWFEEIKSVLPGSYQGAKNHYGDVPEQVFYREHQELVTKTNEWVKKTADSYILVPTLIVTVMFAALFTVPGGNNQDTGIPILLHRKLFLGFLICDAVSLLTASTSLLGFLNIVTKSYSKRNLQRVLSSQTILAVSTLIISIATMILAFIFALAMTLDKKWQVLPAIIIYLVVFPLSILFGWQYPILASICRMTFGSTIF